MVCQRPMQAQESLSMQRCLESTVPNRAEPDTEKTWSCRSGTVCRTSVKNSCDDNEIWKTPLSAKGQPHAEKQNVKLRERQGCTGSAFIFGPADKN